MSRHVDQEANLALIWEALNESNLAAVWSKLDAALKSTADQTQTYDERLWQMIAEAMAHIREGLGLPSEVEREQRFGNPISIHCEKCDTQDVTRDAVVRWNLASQQWETSAIFDNSDCDDCGEVCLVERPLNEKESGDE